MEGRMAASCARSLAGPVLTAFAFAVSCAAPRTPARPESSKEKEAAKFVTEAVRLDDLARAAVWTATDIPSMDLREGPQGKGAVEPFAHIDCDFVPKDMSGSSPKFSCALSKEDEVKIKYGARNPEVFDEIAASRLLWALGFGADRWYPVVVTCRGCSRDPLNPRLKPDAPEHTFDIAALERTMSGTVIESKTDEGWKWTELDRVRADAGGATVAERDALKLLAVLLQHSDSKRQQQRMLCLDPKEEKDQSGACRAPFLMVHDVGLTFGKATAMNTNSSTGINFHNWTSVDVWSDQGACIGNLRKSATGTLENPVIHEAGRKFLADLLQQLSDRQLRDMFEVARFPQYSHVSVDNWVAAFKAKRDAIVQARCPE
jgi:hypothetical protein